MSLVFISHAAVDKQIANQFQQDVKADFLGLCDVFVSSNLDSIQAGFEWNQVIKAKLIECSILIGLLSPIALTRGWVYAEFGAGWVRGIPTVPVCHSGLDRGQLPEPISAFQALNLSEPDHLAHLYTLVAKAVGCNVPQIDFVGRTSSYLETTEGIRTRRLVTDWAKQLINWNPTMMESLKLNGSEEGIMVPANLDQAFQDFVTEAMSRGYLVIKRAGVAIGTRVGPQASVFDVSRGEKFDELVASLN
ncbi:MULTISPECIES: TIR domain-containing protein [unclassified Rhizobium]|uniref:TIR domain-containing protein n=1 Tax=unclassified Rhizobium TaxID=2613769 RepID=UPI001AD9C02C|nr:MULTISPECIES: TIR domain-containing protein [unclassified Rhizobium]MBO9099155.1 toll/interleukin-1 receptor domain-containing protein [Rhizobium sp. L58/93]MBO9132039.1 toll/interleukin-1 receptor domain-containing protein [Rhizobium sp. B209b/85]MBO9169417.1 toll/interleukin-1 receptor domain-containing protein [Rhizobium sp. L245/93]MBO9185368.1 toll/interleukin-1 receptor domain-containing protein [Rhizobium sp. E27B/91]QXZ85507.1 toll/interleukin-1 receptor domain-containing protein [R